jgi:hypothetical protein
VGRTLGNVALPHERKRLEVVILLSANNVKSPEGKQFEVVILLSAKQFEVVILR